MAGWTDADTQHLSELDALIRATETRIEAQVKHLRERGAPWSVIGQALGVSKQAAQQRYGH